MPTTCLRHPSYHPAPQLLPPLLAFQAPHKGVGGTAPASVWDSPQRLVRASALQGIGESPKYSCSGEEKRERPPTSTGRYHRIKHGLYHTLQPHNTHHTPH